MNRQRTFWLTTVIMMAGWSALGVAQTITLSASVVGGGGGLAGDATYRLIGTVAQPAVGFMQSSERMHGTGFWYSFREFVTGVDAEAEGLPTVFRLEQNYPNPFNPGTAVRYQVPSVSEVSLVVFDVLGREVATLAKGRLSPGRYVATFDASRLASGVYFYRLEARSESGPFLDVKKMMLVK